MNRPDTIIISGGDLNRDFALDFIKHNLPCRLIAADKGLQYLCEMDLLPDLVIGDFDSLTPMYQKTLSDLEERGIPVFRLKPQKDETDTQEAFRCARENGAKEVVLLGATGTRLDHVMGNLGLLALARSYGVGLTILDPHNRIRVVSSPLEMNKRELFGKYISFFPLGETVEGLTLQGFAYPLTDFRLGILESGLTVSNEAAEEKLLVTYTSGTLLMIESRD